MSGKIPFIVFEGPDMCGKTSHIDSVVEQLNQLTGKKFKAFKYPVYNGYKGNEILNHLKTFDISRYDHRMYRGMHELDIHADNLMVNKFEALDKAIYIYNTEKCDGFIVDRFDISQLIYDIAWCNFFKGINRKSIRNFFYEAVNRAETTHDYYSKIFDIKYVVFEKSSIIESVALSDNNRRYDKYDANRLYQMYIADLFRMLTLNKHGRKTFLGQICDMDESEFTGAIKFTLAIKRFANPLFDCLSKDNDDLVRYTTILSNNVLCSIDTDSYYYRARIQNAGGDITASDILIDTDNKELVDNIVSIYKSKVTSTIDENIVRSIIAYLEDNRHEC